MNEKLYKTIDKPDEIVPIETLSYKVFLKRKYKKKMPKMRKPIGTSIFMYTVTKYKTADKAINMGISNRSQPFNFKRKSLV